MESGERIWFMMVGWVNVEENERISEKIQGATCDEAAPLYIRVVKNLVR